MARATKKVEVTIHGAMGYGATKAAAMADAAARIQQAFEDDYDYYPAVWTFPHGEQMVLFRTLQGWSYGRIIPGSERQKLYGSGAYETKYQAGDAMLRHVAQDYWDDEATNYGLDLLGESDLEGHQRQKKYRVFQGAYRFYRDEMGYDDAKCHKLACDAEVRDMTLVTANEEGARHASGEEQEAC